MDRIHDSEMTEAIKRNISVMRIAEPIASLLNPRIEVVSVDETGAEISIRIDTRDRDSGRRIAGLETRFYWSYFMAREATKSEQRAAEYIRTALLQCIEHELDESLWIGNARLHEPKHWGV